MKLTSKIGLGIILAFAFLIMTALPTFMQTAPVEKVGAQNLVCQIFPFIADIDLTAGLCGENTEESLTTIGSWLRFILSLVFIGIILVAVVSIVKAAIAYIRSEGDEGKVQEASKAIKAVFVGIGALIVGLVGLAIVLTVIGAEDALQQEDAPDVVDPFFDELTGS